MQPEFYLVSMLVDEQCSPEQPAIFQRLTPTQRWQAAHQLYCSMRRHQAAFLQSQHTGWLEAQVADALREIFSHARS